MKKILLIGCLCIFTKSIAFQDFGEAGNYIPEVNPFKGKLSDYQIIHSEILDYDLRYKIYLPPGYEELRDLSVIYLTDGPGYADTAGGDVVNKIESLVENGRVRPVMAVFIDSGDPDNTSVNRRKRQFFMNEKFVGFIEKELVPFIDKKHPTSADREDRALMGLSFGGLNAAYVGLKAYKTFSKIGMQSPALHPRPEIYQLYQKSGKLPIQIFLSTGTKDDTKKGTRKLKVVLEEKGYELKYMEVTEGHNWQNWNPLIDDALLYFFGY